MKAYADELKRRREMAGLTTRRLGDRIDKSSTFVTDFELARKANPPEPEVMARFADVLGWPVADQLRAWGYRLSTTEPAAENPFDTNDLRWHVVEGMRALDMTSAENEWLMGMFLRELRRDAYPRAVPAREQAG